MEGALVETSKAGVVMGDISIGRSSGGHSNMSSGTCMSRSIYTQTGVKAFDLL